ncbi:MAG: error-prone DNA polymerase [Betaproteobacteria bacterium RIFCSPLOWO2_02_FULL_66_14]|nr:MAG: error-prone DNA polymerase [Betaproteobacteria bacterium RIFCSPLOWO2_02_FULL_66_14]
MASLPELPAYAELHCVSNFTFLRGASHPEELVARAASLGYSALAITDECSFAGIVRAHVAAKKHGLKLIAGVEAELVDGLKVALLATDRRSYGAIGALVTAGRRRSRKGRYSLTREDLAAASGSGMLVLLVTGREAEHALESGTRDRLERDARWIAAHFPDRAWIAAELLCGPNDRLRLDALRLLGHAAGLPLVAAGGVHMHVRSRRRLQDALTAIRLGRPVSECGHSLHPNGERHLRLRSRLAQLYPPELLAETLEVARRCHFSLDELSYEYPEELVPGGETPASWLRQLVDRGLRRRFPSGTPRMVQELVNHELELIAELRYEAFFLTVHDIVSFARSREILCQGRGSAANSAVCYALGITEVDPERMSMLFERFVSRERNEPPDIDVDFEHQRREEVIQYLYSKYGRERTALAATVICYRPRSAVRDLGKVLGMGLDAIEQLAGTLSWWDGKAMLPERLQQAGLDPGDPLVSRLLALAAELIGFPRHLSQHVGGFVISRGALSELVPVENAAMPERTVIQWDKDDLDALGLLKVDVLALGMLSAIRRGLQMAGLRIEEVPSEDPAVYRMIQQADTVGVFQVESRAQMSMLPRLRPERFYDLVIEVAIVRPGPIQGGMVHPYLRRRQGLEAVTYPSEAVKQVLERTLGVPIFQEQVMQLAMVAAGFTPGEADRLRRSMAAWKRKGGLEHFEQRLVRGMLERGYRREFAEAIYRQILGFGEYGFPESHAASFALLVYVSAWLKCHHPAAFLAALLNSQPMGFYAPAQLVQDAQRHGVEVRTPEACVSDWDCTLERPAAAFPGGERNAGAAVRLGMRMISGFSESAAQRVIASRPFQSVEDLARRAGLNRRDLARLADGGALAALSGHRRLAHWATAGVSRGEGALASVLLPEAPAALAPPSEGEGIVADYASLGLTLGRHPLALLRTQLRRLGLSSAEALRAIPHGRRARTAGLVTCRQRPDTASGVIFLTLEDETGSSNVVVWRDIAERQRRELLGARLLGVQGVIERDGEVVHLVAHRLVDHSRLLADRLGPFAVRSRDFH